MDDSRILAAILFLGAAAIIGKLIDLRDWHVHEEPIVVDTSTNGGVRTTAWSGTSTTAI